MNDKKEFSARKFMAVWFSAVYGIIMLILTYALAIRIVNVETYVAILASFVLILREITDAYFKRSDRSINEQSKKEVV